MSELAPTRCTWRRIGAVLAGLLVIVVQSIATDTVLHATGLFPPHGEPMADAPYMLALAYHILYGIAGGYVTARLAPDRPLGHALVLGGIGVVLSAIGAAVMWDAGPAWYPLSLVVIALPCAWVGTRLHAGRVVASVT
jgi:hypothetical protein